MGPSEPRTLLSELWLRFSSMSGAAGLLAGLAVALLAWGFSGDTKIPLFIVAGTTILLVLLVFALGAAARSMQELAARNYEAFTFAHSETNRLQAETNSLSAETNSLKAELKEAMAARKYESPRPLLARKPEPEGDASADLFVLTDRADWLPMGVSFSVFSSVGELEEPVGIGWVINVQTNGMLQLAIVLNSSAAAQNLMNFGPDNRLGPDALKSILVRPSLPWSMVGNGGRKNG